MRKHNWKSAATPCWALAIALLSTVLMSQSAKSQTFSVIYNFTGGQDGATPKAGLTIDAGGNLYGTNFAGGPGYGVAFTLKHVGSGWTLNPIYSFTGGTDGAGSSARVIFGRDGSLYGSTIAGGGGECVVYGYNGCGTVFKLSVPPAALSPWTETVLYRFTGGSDGAFPFFGDLNFDQAGNIYGTAQNYPNPGNVYELIHSGGTWTHTVLYTFNAPGDGCFPTAGVTFDRAGNLYGASSGCGIQGTFWTLTPSGSGWSENVLYRFPQDLSEGENIYGGLIIDQAGNFYGAASDGGPGGGGGTAFELTPSSGNWTLSRLYGFAGNRYCGPYSSLIMDQAGNLYGTTLCDGRYGYGSVFKLTPSGDIWTYTSLHDFTGGSDGANPFGGVVFDAIGNIYGTAAAGGTGSACTDNCGVVFEITP